MEEKNVEKEVKFVIDEDTKLLMLQELKKINETLSNANKIEVVGSAVLNSSNPVLVLNANYYYSGVMWLNGSPSSDVYVFLNPVTEQDSANTPIRFNTTQNKIRFKNLRLNQLSVVTSGTGAIGSSAIYFYFVASDKSTGEASFS